MLGAQPQRAQGLADRGVVDVAGHVGVEDVGAHQLAGGPRGDAGQVHAALGELAERADERARGVGQSEGHRGAVAPGARRRAAGRADEHEAGAGSLDVGDALGQAVQAEEVGGAGGRGGGVDLALGDHARGRPVGGAGHELHAGGVGGQPAAHLLVADRVAGQAAHVGQRGAGPGHDGEGDVEVELVVDLDLAGGQGVEGLGDRPVDGVLDGDHAEGGPPGAHGVEDLGRRAQRQGLGGGVRGPGGAREGPAGGELQHGGLGERAGRAEVGDGGLHVRQHIARGHPVKEPARRAKPRKRP